MIEKIETEPGYNEGIHPDLKIKVELYVNDRAEAIVFYDRPFNKQLSWLEYDLDDDRMDFVMEDGDIRNFGIPIDPKLKKYLQNSHQVLMVKTDDKSGQKIEAVEGEYFPIIIHRA
jgi:threonyl-tRNA synthetase